MVRLQRVTFTALHQYLGLSAELVNPSSHKKKHSSVTGSPVRSRTRENFAMPSADNIMNSYPGVTEQLQIDVTQRELYSGASQPVPIMSSRRYLMILFTISSSCKS